MLINQLRVRKLVQIKEKLIKKILIIKMFMIAQITLM